MSNSKKGFIKKVSLGYALFIKGNDFAITSAEKFEDVMAVAKEMGITQVAQK